MSVEAADLYIDGEAIWPSDHAAVVADFVTPI